MTSERERHSGESVRSGRVRRWSAWLLVVLAVLGVSGELFLRSHPQLCPPQQQLKILESQQGFDDFVDDPYLGARPRGGSDEMIRTMDYRYRLQLDSLGFPNHEPWPDSVDVVVLGNSLIVGPGVGLEGQFSTLLGRRLGGRRILNLGLPGGSPLQELRLYTKYALPLHPRLVVATLWVASDVDNDIQFKSWLADGSPPGFTTYRDEYGTTHGRFEVIKKFRDFLSRSYLLRALYYEAKSIWRPSGLPAQVRFPDGESLVLSVRAEQRLAEGAHRPGLDLPKDFIGPLVRIRTLADSAGSRLLVVLMPSKEEVYASEVDPDVLSTVRDVRAGLAAAHLPVLDLYGLFRQRGRTRPLFFKRDIHFNARGNELVAAAIGMNIEKDGIFPIPGTDEERGGLNRRH